MRQGRPTRRDRPNKGRASESVGRTSASTSAGSRPGPSATAGRQDVGVVVGGRSVASDESGVCRALTKAEGRSSAGIEGRYSPSRAEDRTLLMMRKIDFLQGGR